MILAPSLDVEATLLSPGWRSVLERPNIGIGFCTIEAAESLPEGALTMTSLDGHIAAHDHPKCMMEAARSHCERRRFWRV